MRLSNKSTFFLAFLILLFAFATVPAMANTMTAIWSDDLDTDTDDDQPGWMVTLTYATAPTAANAPAASGFTIAPSGAATVTGLTPTASSTPAVTDTDRVFKFNLALDTSNASTKRADVDITVPDVGTGATAVKFRRVTLINGQDLATGIATSIKLPTLNSITAPKSSNGVVTATIRFSTPANPASPSGPALGLKSSDILLTASDGTVTGTVISVTSDGTFPPSAYTVSILITVDTTISLSSAAATPFPHVADDVATDNTATVIFDNERPQIGAIALTRIGSNRILDTTSVSEAFDINVAGIMDTPASVADEALTVSFAVTPDSPQGAMVSDVAKVAGAMNTWAATITPNPNTGTTDWGATPITITVTVMDMAGNTNTKQTMVTLAARAAGAIANRAPAFAATASISDITATAGTAITSVTLPAATDPDSGATLTYSITPAVGNGLMFDAATRVLSGTPTAAMAQKAYTYTVSDGTLTDTLTFNITVMAAAVVVDPTVTEFRIAANSFVVVVRDDEMGHVAFLRAHKSDIAIHEWDTMPDLQNVFDTNAVTGGGALILEQAGNSAAMGYVARSPGTVGISEVMWAIDESQLGNAGLQRANQWIEIHNLNVAKTDGTDDGSVMVKLSWKSGATAISTDTTINGDLSHPKLDVVTNVFNNRPGNAFWVLPGHNGNPNSGVNFASMARVPKRGAFSIDRRHENNAGKARDGLYTRWGDGGANGANQSKDGRESGSWTTSTTTYGRDSTNLGIGLGTVVYDFLGTPGRVNTFSPQRAETTAGRTSVPSNTVIFNEVANRSNEAHEWIELRNVSDGEINLKNYLISIVESKPSQDNRNKADNDKIFYQFPSNDKAKIAAGGVFLLVASDPRGNPDHPLAVGYNVDIDDEDQVVGSRKNPIRYKVMRKSDQAAYQYEGTGLPDSGKFVLILRRPDNHEGHRSGADGGKGVAERGKDDLDKVIDVAGWHDDLHITNYPNSVSSTRLWPLRNFRAPNFNNNKFSPNIVRLRIRGAHGLGGVNDGASGVGAEGNHNDHRAAWRQDGYSGIGYKLQAADSAANGGTPGYHGNVRGKSADLAGDKVIISEIMLSQGNRGNLPQWIELYNPSKTHAVNLADNAGWRLVIENPDRAPIITINFKNKGNVKVIPPNSTVLIVSSSARDYGSDDLPRGTVFPNTRVLNAYTAIRGETFELASRTSPLIGPKAFNIRLLDGKTHDNKPGGRYIGEVSDEVGNLDGNPRTNDAPAWEFPDGMTADKDRTSIIRIFNNGVARDGMGMVEPLNGTGDGGNGMAGIDMKYSWIHASDTEDLSRIFVRHTWYGDESDFGSPGDRTGQVLPVELSFFRPTLADGKVTIRWTTESELDNAGFNILRSETRNGEFKQVNTELIQGAGTTGERTTYNWVDPTAKPGVVYYYQIEDVSFAGEHQVLATTKLKGLISADGKLTTTWSELKQASQ